MDEIFFGMFLKLYPLMLKVNFFEKNETRVGFMEYFKTQTQWFLEKIENNPTLVIIFISCK
jgi:hypothetical protein